MFTGIANRDLPRSENDRTFCILSFCEGARRCVSRHLPTEEATKLRRFVRVTWDPRVTTKRKCCAANNFGNGRPVENMRFIRNLEQLLDEEAIIEHLPTPPSEPLETFADISKARALLGYNPQTTVEEGMATFVEWYKREVHQA